MVCVLSKLYGRSVQGKKIYLLEKIQEFLAYDQKFAILVFMLVKALHVNG